MKIPFLTEDTRMVLAVLEKAGAGASDGSALRNAYNTIWEQSNGWNRMVLGLSRRLARRTARKRLRKERAASDLEDARVTLAKALMGEDITREAACLIAVVPPGVTYSYSGISYFNSRPRACELVLTKNGVRWQEPAILDWEEQR